MKTLCLTFILAAAFACHASARMVWIPYENLSQKEKDAWGYILERMVGADGYAFFQLSIPPKAAALFQDAGLTVRDKQHRVLVSSSLGFFKGTDGCLCIRIERFQDFGDVELAVTTNELPEAPFHGDIGGFTFSIPADAKRP